MMDKKLDALFYQIKANCFDLIKKKDINFLDFAFELGMDSDDVIHNFIVRCKDFSFYLKAYDLLMKW